jgi:hypothetical protein
MHFTLRRSVGPPEPHAAPHPLMQASIDFTRPFIVATDHAVWGTFDSLEDATRRWHDVMDAETVGERVAITTPLGRVINEGRGRNLLAVRATSR